ncbi:hypothetical protein CHARACLAT_013377 [Characodon lateralis]|uniref:Uncharacterized protein n=1 Tax=Characodon lateralis TaxID=208331 RepID=A0ABU7CXE1_9TELE|nr:hypothetical protein [Characodon lateralis]
MFLGERRRHVTQLSNSKLEQGGGEAAKLQRQPFLENYLTTYSESLKVLEVLLKTFTQNPQRFAKYLRSTVTDLPLQVCGLVRRRSGQDAGVTEACPEQHPHHEDKEDGADRRDGRTQMGCQIGTAEDTETG